MYVSRTVERIREDPDPDASISLVLRTGEGDEPDAVGEAVEAVGGTVERRLEFGDLLVTVDQTAVDEVCGIDGIEAVETDAAIDQTAGDAGEDLGV